MAATIKVATAPCSWGVWYPDGRPSGVPWKVFLDQASRAGYKYLELGPVGYLPTDLEVLTEELDSRGFGVCAGTVCYRFDHFQSFDDFRPEIDALCARLGDLGAEYLVAMDESDVGRFGEKKETFSPALWVKWLAMIRDLAAYTRSKYGIETVFHPHVRSLIETEVEIRRLLDFCDIKLCLDTGHHTYTNGGVVPGDSRAIEFIRKYQDRIAYLHFKNVDGKVRRRVQEEHLDSDTAFDLEVMCDLRNGIVDFRELKDTLDEMGYQGIGVIEMDMPKATAAQCFAAATRNLAYLRTLGMVD